MAKPNIDLSTLRLAENIVWVAGRRRMVFRGGNHG